MLTQEPTNVTMTDPLAMQFMTQGQMGYMPQAQFLTPAEYGAFRTMPTSPQNNFLHQDPGFLQSFLIRNYGGPFGLPKYTFNTYNPAVNQQAYMNALAQRSWDQTLAAGGAVADIGMSALVGSMAGMAFGGPAGIAAGLLMPGLSSGVTDRVRDLRAVQNLTMAKIVGGRDVNPVTGMGFNAASARRMDSFLRMSAADDVVLKEGDWRRLLQLGIENGQFDYANSAQQYKDILKKLRGTMTTMMEVVGSSDFKDVMKEFKRLQTMGADISQYRQIARQENLFSRITGLSHADMVNTYGQQGALIYSQAGLTGYQGSLQAMSNAATVALGQRMGLIAPDMLARYGGASGLAQTMTQQDAQAQKRMQDFILPFLMNNQGTGLDRNADLGALLRSENPLLDMSAAAGNKIRTVEDMMRYQRSRNSLYNQAMDTHGAETMELVFANSIGRAARMNGREATEFGFRQLGYDPEIAHQKTETFYSDTYREQQERERQLERRKRREEEDLANNPFRKLARTLDKALTRAGEGLFGGIVDTYSGWVERRNLAQEGLVDTGGMPSGRAGTAHGEVMRAAASGREVGTPVSQYGGAGSVRAKVKGVDNEVINKVRAEAARQGVDPEVALAIMMTESDGRRNIGVNSAKAAGLFQVTPSAAEDMGASAESRLNENKNIELGIGYFNKMLKKYGNVEDALRAYNWGPGKVDNWIKNGRKQEELPAETRNYLPRFYGFLEHNVRSGVSEDAAQIAGDVLQQINDSVGQSTSEAVRKGVSYGWRSKSSAQGRIDCSGWVDELLTTVFDSATEEGKKVFGDQAKQALHRGHNREGAAGIIQDLAQLAGEEYQTSDLAPDKAKAGMVIGLDTKRNTGEQAGRYKDIDHIVYTYEKNGEVYVTESTSDSYGNARSGNNGVRDLKYSDWYDRQVKRKNAKLYGVDIRRLSDKEIERRRSGRAGASPSSQTNPADELRRQERIAHAAEQMHDPMRAAMQEAMDNGSAGWGFAPGAESSYVNFAGAEAIFAHYDADKNLKYSDLSQKIQEITGKELSVDERQAFADAVKNNKIAVGDITTKEGNAKYIEKILSSIKSLGKEDIYKLSQDRVFTAALSAKGLHNLDNGEENDVFSSARRIYDTEITKRKEKRNNLVRDMRDSAKKEQMSIMYPGLGDASRDDAKKLQEEYMSDDGAYLGIASRMASLKTAYYGGAKDKKYRDAFIRQAVDYLGMSQDRAEKLFDSENDIAAEDFKGTKAERFLKDDVLQRHVAFGNNYARTALSEKTDLDKALIQNYKDNYVAVLDEKEAESAAGLAELAEKTGISVERLKTPEGRAEAKRLIVDNHQGLGKYGERVRRFAESGDASGLLDTSKATDSETYAGQKIDAAQSAQDALRQQDLQNTLLRQQAYGTPKQGSEKNGGRLSDSTVNGLTAALNSLVSMLQKLEHRIK